jgi:hypothetical protein
MQRPGINYSTASEHICGKSREWIDAYATKAADALSLAPGGDVMALTQRLGGRVSSVSLFDPQLGPKPDTIWVHGPRDFDIILPDHTTARRDRFTIAHELGHYFLHSFSGQFPLTAARSGADRAEWEASTFAAGFLMPQAAFINDFREMQTNGHSIAWLAGRFGVSETAARIRCQVLALTERDCDAP